MLLSRDNLYLDADDRGTSTAIFIPADKWNHFARRRSRAAGWPAGDIYGEPELIEASIKMCDNGRMVRLDKATHWTLADEPERITELVLGFLKI